MSYSENVQKKLEIFLWTIRLSKDMQISVLEICSF